MNFCFIFLVEDGRCQFDVRCGDVGGSLLIQELLKLKRNRTVTLSLLNLSDKTLIELAMDSKGTHIIQALLKSPTVTEENKMTIGSIFKVFGLFCWISEHFEC